MDVHYRDFLQAVASGIVVHDSTGAIVDANPAACAMLGLPLDQLLGLTSLDERWHAIHEDGSPFPGETHPAMVALRTGQPVRDVVMGVFAQTDSPRWLLINATPIPDRVTGRITTVVANFVDVTDRKRAEDERSKLLRQLDAERMWLRTIIEQSPAGIIVVEGAHAERVVANHRAEELFGQCLTPERLTSAQYLGQLSHPDGAPMTYEEMAGIRALRGETVEAQEELLRQPNGHMRTILVSASPIRDASGAIVGAVVALEDVTQIRELERQREEWTSAIAHELRQPLTIVTGYASMLAHQSAEYPPPVRAAIDHIVSSTRQLSRMISDLLDVSRIASQRLTLDRQPVDVVALVQSVQEGVAAVRKDRRVRIEVRGEVPRLEADSVRIEQILSNLLSNAVKYGDPVTEIRVEVTRRERYVEVAVTNQGAGIPADELSRLFSRFYRTSEARTGREGGLGLGLYICKGLVEAHGGQIWAESGSGETTFRFTLPLPA
jgi:PAS domain S-box-containing protein